MLRKLFGYFSVLEVSKSFTIYGFEIKCLMTDAGRRELEKAR